jgi:hypothetical protein
MFDGRSDIQACPRVVYAKRIAYRTARDYTDAEPHEAGGHSTPHKSSSVSGLCVSSSCPMFADPSRAPLRGFPPYAHLRRLVVAHPCSLVLACRRRSLQTSYLRMSCDTVLAEVAFLLFP